MGAGGPGLGGVWHWGAGLVAGGVVTCEVASDAVYMNTTYRQSAPGRR